MSTTDPNSWAYHDDFAQIIVTKDRQVARRLLEAADLALNFARALVAKEYERAYGMLSLTLQSTCSPTALKNELDEMIWISERPDDWPTGVQVITGTDGSEMREWAREAPEDFGWIYVSISGKDYCEAVAPTIAVEGDKLVIRSIDWGRP